MQPASHSARPAEDLHSILNRFQTWAGKQPENHNGHKQNSEGVHEIPMEEALRQLRSRRAKPATPTAERPPAPQPPIVPVAREMKSKAAAKSNPLSEAVTPAVKRAEAPRPAAQAKPVAKASAAAGPAKNNAVAKQRTVQNAMAQATRPAAPTRKRVRRPGEAKPRVRRKAVQEGRPTAVKPGRKNTPRKAAFREVLRRRVGEERADEKQDRRQRVSVRLSSAERRRLQQRAAAARLSISEYLRQSALQTETQLREIEQRRGRNRTRESKSPAGVQLFASSTPQNNAGPGGWIALLRNRFLASPQRIAERA